MYKNIFVAAICMVTLSTLADASKEEQSILDKFLPSFRQLKALLNYKIEAASKTRLSRNFMILNGKLQNSTAYTHFPCSLNFTLRSKQRPKSAHELRPGDIDVVGAIGDSLTAGFGVDATLLLAVLHEGRGSSFSIGGQGTWRTHLTLPNILRNYNAKVYGSSLNSVTTDRKSKFNVAEGGAISENMPYMAKVLVKRIKNDKNVDLENDWKMITVFIGHNDICSVVCYKNNKEFDETLGNHKMDMLEVLRIFRDSLPRTVINLIPPIHLRILFTMTDKAESCEVAHRFFCPCLFGSRFSHLRPKVLELMTKWQQLDLEIADYKEFDTDDFTVIAHNFTLNYTLPKLRNGRNDYGYMAPDCFHASQRGHAKGDHISRWNESSGGYQFHVISGASEWILVLGVILYLSLYAGEFKSVVLFKPKIEIRDNI